jgi:asparagine synthase (glutamine-hydrolysing)
LSILDLSVAARQPMASSDGRFWLTYNGEIYNHLELRSELEEGFSFRTRCDAEVLLAAWQRWGPDALRRLDGMFAFALWDAGAGRLFLARDPLGIKPLYWGRDAAGFLFGSEPRAVLAGLGTPGSVDAARLAEFLLMGLSDADEGTMFAEVRQLPGGHWAEVGPDGREPRVRRYWQPPVEEGADAKPDAVLACLTKAVATQLRADVPVGSCLSGGIDSGAVVSLACRHLGADAREYHALTLVSPDFEGNEAELARATAARAGCRWIPVEPAPGALADRLIRVADSAGEPFAGLSVVAQHALFERAAGLGLKVMLDGQGGDEVFAGYPRLAGRVVLHHLARWRVTRATTELLALRRNLGQSPFRTLASAAYFSSRPIAMARAQARMSGLVAPALLTEARREVAEELFRPRGFSELQRAELERYCLPRLLRYEDRNSMAWGVEARVPLLATPVVELGLSLRPDVKVHDGWSKHALRVAMADLLPPEVTWSRVKRGFDVPEAAWARALAPQLADWLSELPAGGPILKDGVRAAMTSRHLGAQWLWRVISTVLWIRVTGVRT